MRKFRSPIAQTPLHLYGPSLGSVGVSPVLRALPALPRHQVLRISAADEAQVQKVKELEDLEHLQVSDSVQASLGTPGPPQVPTAAHGQSLGSGPASPQRAMRLSC